MKKYGVETVIKLLIVEDNADKLRTVTEKFDVFNSSNGKVSISYEAARDVLQATEMFNTTYHDVVILDLKLPLNIEDAEKVKVEYAKGFHDYVMKSERKPFLIVGLTALNEGDYQDEFSAHSTFSIERFSFGLDTWFDNIIARIMFVVSARQALSAVMSNNFNFDIIIMVARENNEFNPIVEAIDWMDGFHFRHSLLHSRKNAFGRARFGAKILDVGVVCLGEMGLSASSAMATQLVHMFRPRYFAMLGMCCGFRNLVGAETKLGDVIIARQTANWDEGMYEANASRSDSEPFFQNRTKERSPSGGFEADISRVLESQKSAIESGLKDFYLSSAARNVIDQLQDFDSNASIHYELLLSGSSVINSVSKSGEIRKRFSTAVGLEMEGHSIYVAMNCLTGIQPKSVVIKGVADYGDGSKTKVIQKIASKASFLVLKQILDSIEAES